MSEAIYPVLAPFAQGQELRTNEPRPRLITVLGAWAMNPEMTVAKTADGQIVHVYPTGYCPDLGRNVFVKAHEARNDR